MSTYDTEIDLSALNTSHAQVADLVGVDQRVLDVGCWKGELGAALRQRGCVVSGLEIDEAAAEVARGVLDDVLVANLDTTSLTSLYGERRFDAVVFADVLEHLVDPVGVLSNAGRLLAPGGRVVISLPNITHGSVRLALLHGGWRYTETGLLDRTHIRFFSRGEVVRLMRLAGFAIDDLRATIADVLAVEVLVDAPRLPSGTVDWVRHQPDALVYQFVVGGRPVADAMSAPVPDLVPGVDPLLVLPDDDYTAQVSETHSLRHQLLVLRDHVLGLESAAAAGRRRAQAAEEKEHAVRRRLDRKNEVLMQLRRRARRAERRLADRPAPAPPAPTPAPVLQRVRRRLARPDDAR